MTPPPPPRLGPGARIHRRLVRLLIFLGWRTEFRGAEHMARVTREPMVLAANHVSFLDGPLYGCLFPPELITTIDGHMGRRGYGGWLARRHRVIIVDAGESLAIRDMARALRQGACCQIFPEGRLTRDGSLSRIHPGAAVLADQAKVPVMPVHAEGLQYSPFSHLGGRVRTRWFPKLRLTFLGPRWPDLPADLRGAARRAALKRFLEDAMTDARVVSTHEDVDLATHFEDLCRRVLRPDQVLLEAGEHRLDARTVRRRLRRGIAGVPSGPGPVVAVAMAPGVALILTVLALWRGGRAVVPLDPTAAVASWIEACRKAGATEVLCTAGAAADARAALEGAGLVPRDIDPAVPASRRPRQAEQPDPASPALVLPAAGANGDPVVLAHRNLLANRARMAARLSFNPPDAVYTAFGVTHPAGLLGGMLLPLLCGCRLVLAPEPITGSRLAAELSMKRVHTVLLDTATLRPMGDQADPLDFRFLQQVVCPGETLDCEWRRALTDRHGLRPLPALIDARGGGWVSTVTPGDYRPDRFGRLMPLTDAWADGDGLHLAGSAVPGAGACIPGAWRLEGDEVLGAG